MARRNPITLMPQILDEERNVVVVTFEATPRRTHSAGAKVTDYPVEEGVDASDHSEPGSIVLRMNALISPHSLYVTHAPGYVQRVLEVLEALRISGRRVTVVTPLRRYPNMVLQSLTAIESESFGDGVSYDLSFKEVRVVNSAVVGVPADILDALIRASGKSKGSAKKAPREETKKEQTARRKSLAKGLKDALLGGS